MKDPEVGHCNVSFISQPAIASLCCNQCQRPIAEFYALALGLADRADRRTLEQIPWAATESMLMRNSDVGWLFVPSKFHPRSGRKYEKTDSLQQSPVA